ncbi:MAG TPA: excisionase family DNA-binding protein [Pyrinomonadaceae bacterium]|jgi:excisionase family DNA binding protein
MEELEGYLTVNEAAERRGITGGRIRQFISENRLASIKVGNTRLIKTEDLDRLEIKKSGGQKKEKVTRSALSKRKTRGEK